MQNDNVTLGFIFVIHHLWLALHFLTSPDHDYMTLFTDIGKDDKQLTFISLTCSLPLAFFLIYNLASNDLIEIVANTRRISPELVIVLIFIVNLSIAQLRNVIIPKVFENIRIFSLLISLVVMLYIVSVILCATLVFASSVSIFFSLAIMSYWLPVWYSLFKSMAKNK